MTDNGLGTAWIDALDPVFGEIADAWMAQLVQDFGTDHWYQLDGYFDGGTAPWVREAAARRLDSGGGGATPPVPDPTWHHRGVEAYRSLTAADPDATWSFQGFAFVNWDTPEKASAIQGFIKAAPPGKFVIIDMDISTIMVMVIQRVS